MAITGSKSYAPTLFSIRKIRRSFDETLKRVIKDLPIGHTLVISFFLNKYVIQFVQNSTDT